MKTKQQVKSVRIPRLRPNVNNLNIPDDILENKTVPDRSDRKYQTRIDTINNAQNYEHEADPLQLNDVFELEIKNTTDHPVNEIYQQLIEYAPGRTAVMEDESVGDKVKKLRANLDDLKEYSTKIKDTSMYYSTKQPANTTATKYMKGLLVDMVHELVKYKKNNKIRQEDLPIYTCVTQIYKEQTPVWKKSAAKHSINVHRPSFDTDRVLSAMTCFKNFRLSDVDEKTPATTIFKKEFIDALTTTVGKMYMDDQVRYANCLNELVLRYSFNPFGWGVHIPQRLDYKAFESETPVNCVVEIMQKYVKTKKRNKLLMDINDKCFDENKQPIGCPVSFIEEMAKLIKDKYKTVQVSTVTYRQNIETVEHRFRTSVKSEDTTGLIQIMIYKSHAYNLTGKKVELPVRPKVTKFVQLSHGALDDIVSQYKGVTADVGGIDMELKDADLITVGGINPKIPDKIFYAHDKNDYVRYTTYKPYQHASAMSLANEGKLMFNIPHDMFDDSETKLPLRRCKKHTDVLFASKPAPYLFVNKGGYKSKLKIDGNNAFYTRMRAQRHDCVVPLTYQWIDMQALGENFNSIKQYAGFVWYKVKFTMYSQPNLFMRHLFNWQNHAEPQLVMSSIKYLKDAFEMLKFHNISTSGLTIEYCYAALDTRANVANATTVVKLSDITKTYDYLFESELTKPQIKHLMAMYNMGIGSLSSNNTQKYSTTFSADEEQDAMMLYHMYMNDEDYIDVVIQSPADRVYGAAADADADEYGPLFEAEQAEQVYTVSASLACKSYVSHRFPELLIWAFETTKLSCIDMLLNFNPDQIVAVTMDSIAYTNDVTKDQVMAAFENTFYKQSIKDKYYFKPTELGHSWKFEDYSVRPNEHLYWPTITDDKILDDLQTLLQSEFRFKTNTYVHGVAGSGKSYLVNQSLNKYNSQSATKTRELASKMPHNGSTIHKLCNLDVTNKFAYRRFDKQDKRLTGNLPGLNSTFIFIDEVDCLYKRDTDRIIKQFPYSILLFAGHSLQLAPFGYPSLDPTQFNYHNKTFERVEMKTLHRFTHRQDRNFQIIATNTLQRYADNLQRMKDAKDPKAYRIFDYARNAMRVFLN